MIRLARQSTKIIMIVYRLDHYMDSFSRLCLTFNSYSRTYYYVETVMAEKGLVISGQCFTDGSILPGRCPTTLAIRCWNC